MRDAESGGRRVWRRGWVGSAGDAGGRRVGGDAGGRRVGGDAGGRRVGGGAGDSSVATSGVGLTGLAGYRAGGDGGGRRVGGGAGDEGSAVGEATSGVGLTGLAGYRVRGGGGRHAGYRVGRARRVRHFLAARLVTIMVCALGGSTAAGAPAIESAPGTVHAEVVSERGHKVPGEEGAGGVTTFSERTDGTAMTTPDGTTTTPVSEGTVTATIRELAALRATDKDADASERYISSLPAEIIEAL